MRNDTYWRSKIPVPLALLFVLNLVIVMALEVLLVYRLPAELTVKALAEYNSAYESCTILQTADRGKLSCYLVETADGEVHLIPTHGHSIAYKRTKVLKKYITVIPEDQEITVPVKIGLHTSNVTVQPEPLSGTHYINIDYYGGGTQATATLYMVIAAVLEAIELAVFHLIRYGFH